MRLEVKVIIETGWCEKDLGEPKPGEPLGERIRASVEEAVEHALRYAAGEGFVHDLDSLIALNVQSVEATVLSGSEPKA